MLATSRPPRDQSRFCTTLVRGQEQGGREREEKADEAHGAAYHGEWRYGG
jgi:hypothetical protein